MPPNDTDPGPGPDYEPPAITDLGTLAELTMGGSPGMADGAGSAGSVGSV